MNDKIKEFAGKALDKAVSYTWTQLDYDQIQELLACHAELIVKECVEQGKLIQSQTIVNGSEEYVAGREMGIEVFMNQIKKHFGVDE
jgi:hypothetical protein